MAERGAWRIAGRPVGAWAEPMRRVVSRILPGDDDPAAPDIPAGEWLVDCAVYVDGRRLPNEPDFRAALRTAAREDGFVWLGVRDPTQAEFQQVADVFGLHELAVEEAVTASHRPKIERYGDVTLFVMRTTRYLDHPFLSETSEVVETGEVLVFIGDHFVITVRHGAPGELATVRADLEKRPDLLRFGPWSVAHAVSDRLVDSYLEVAHGFEADLDVLEEHVFSQVTSDRIAHIYQLKRELMEFKRAVAPLQRPLAAIVEDKDLLAKEIRRYFRDVNDTLLRVVERVASYDDLLNSILQAHLAQVTVTQNNDMRKIASWAAIAAAQTAIAGVYGMNFDYMPELHWRYGYPVVFLLMVVSAYSLHRAFRRSGWL
ncbi:magnesium transporter [Allocatelliglobosispora scoriae]|uniref:Magnesium transport protein CorA n=1 Tax=Allocatelliglobosispora scoriae TaxID=643052 RepID=A0A841BIK9_9ACTN|nr:magnesium/cobalt transporter CorA [Allocatelliglobosispora scoriae]MBB5867026.1 magnesium transporter [Allocatelliglobosispora scoriae]